MAKIGVTFNLDVTKIEKARLYVGKKGKYLSFTSFIDIDQKDEYDNNGMMTQDVSKEEREGGVQGPILGNCKVFWSGESQPRQTPQQQQQAQTPAMDDLDEEIPF